MFQGINWCNSIKLFCSKSTITIFVAKTVVMRVPCGYAGLLNWTRWVVDCFHHNHDVRYSLSSKVFSTQPDVVLWRSSWWKKQRRNLFSMRSMSARISVSQAYWSRLRYKLVKKGLESAPEWHVQYRSSCEIGGDAVRWSRRRYQCKLRCNDFALRMMSKEQIKMWNNSRRLVCMDATYSFTKHKLKVLTVIVIGPKECEVPVATLISSREDATTLRCLFSKIRNLLQPSTQIPNG